MNPVPPKCKAWAEKHYWKCERNKTCPVLLSQQPDFLTAFWNGLEWNFRTGACLCRQLIHKLDFRRAKVLRFLLHYFWATKSRYTQNKTLSCKINSTPLPLFWGTPRRGWWWWWLPPKLDVKPTFFVIGSQNSHRLMLFSVDFMKVSVCVSVVWKLFNFDLLLKGFTKEEYWT